MMMSLNFEHKDMKKNLIVYVAIFFILCLFAFFDETSAKAEKSKISVSVYSGDSGCMAWPSVTNLEIKNNVVKFLDLEDGNTYTLVNMATVIREREN